MELPSLPKTDVAKIVGPYQLLYVIAAVIEGLLGYWFYRADSGVERGFAGVLMALILLGMFYTVIAIKRLEKTGLDSSPDVVTAIHPPLGGDTTAEEIAAPGPEVIAGPDSSFLISSPPDGWDERSVTLSDWVGEALDVKDPATRERMIPSAGQSPDILILERTQRTSIIPNPGRTTVDGRKLPTALEIPCPTQLAIIPLVRAQPPFFIERPLENNFLTFVSQFLGLGVLTAKNLKVGLIPASGRRYIQLDLQQSVQGAIVNGRDGQDVVVTISVMGIEGTLRDHLLISKYATVKGDPEEERNVQTLKGLVASFRPLKVANAEEKRKQMAAEAEDNFKTVLSEQGAAMFIKEFQVALMRLQGADMEDPEVRLRAMRLVKPFEAFAAQIELHDDPLRAKLDVLWGALHRAEAGDATDFKNELKELI